VIVLPDPEGFFLELDQPFTIPQTAGSPASNVLESSFELMVTDAGITLRQYTEGLGFDPRVGAFDGTKLYVDIGGTPGAHLSEARRRFQEHRSRWRSWSTKTSTGSRFEHGFWTRERLFSSSESETTMR
jgi:hypothetical protein